MHSKFVHLFLTVKLSIFHCWISVYYKNKWMNVIKIQLLSSMTWILSVSFLYFCSLWITNEWLLYKLNHLFLPFKFYLSFSFFLSLQITPEWVFLKFIHLFLSLRFYLWNTSMHISYKYKINASHKDSVTYFCLLSFISFICIYIHMRQI